MGPTLVLLSSRLSSYVCPAMFWQPLSEVEEMTRRKRRSGRLQVSMFVQQRSFPHPDSPWRGFDLMMDVDQGLVPIAHVGRWSTFGSSHLPSYYHVPFPFPRTVSKNRISPASRYTGPLYIPSGSGQLLFVITMCLCHRRSS